MQKLADTLPAVRQQTVPADAAKASSEVSVFTPKTADQVLRMWTVGTEFLFNTPASAKKILADQIPRLEGELRPATRQQMAVALDKLFVFAEALGKGPPNAEAATQIWAEALSDLPPDLLTLAIDRVIRGHGFNTLPPPAEIAEKVEGEMAQRRHKLAMARQCIG